ncbi:MAG: hypothetical protein KDB53_11655 [Planctomycetes bacterium]|nr:hypothetical protein [Planctomycetota bacterium]
MKRSIILLVLVLVLQPSTLHADEGNGQGQAYVRPTPVRIGGAVTIAFGSPGLAFGQALLIVADNPGPVVHPQLGLVCLDILGPSAQIALSTLLDANGNASLTVGVPNLPQLVGFAPAYALALTVDFSIPGPVPISLSKTVRLNFANPDGYLPAGTLSITRALHTATALGADGADNRTRVLVAGGGSGTILSPVASDTTEIYSPLHRSFSPGPTMAVERALHQSLRLDDGRVLIIGGVDSNGLCSTSCETFDPATGQFTATGSMIEARAGHVATKLANGKVLVTGGVATIMGGSTNIATVLMTARNSAELFDPVTGVWTLLPAMAAPRFEHAQVLLPGGGVLIAGGINGGTTVFGQGLPTYTNSCEVFDPTTNSFFSTGSLPQGLAGHGLSVLANGDVLATGGIRNIFFVPTAVPDASRWNGATWSATATLSGGVAFHTQLASRVGGQALIHGGLSGTLLALGASAVAGRHDGTAFTAAAPIGVDPGIPGSSASARGSHTMVELFDGSYLLVGGADGNSAFANAFTWIE